MFQGNPAQMLKQLAKDPKRLAELKRRVDAEKGRRTLKDFVKMAWPWIEPHEFRENWHIDLICEHLQAVTYGEVSRLLINMPPRTMKSKLVSVLWPIWTWIQNEAYGEDDYKIPTCGPGTKFLCFTYADTLSLDMSLDCRAVIDNDKFRHFYGDHVQLRPDQTAKRRFDNMQGGYRIATSVRGAATGFGGDVLDVDDPQKIVTSAKSADLEMTLRWFSETLPTRLNDRKRGAIVVTMQRTHERDVSGYILGKDLDYTHLCLPMHYDERHPYISGFDPRTEDGELLWPEHMAEKEVNDLQKTLGSYASAGQLEQRPAPREGGMFKRSWLPIVEVGPNQVVDRVRAWDLAGTAKTLLSSDPDWTAGVRVSLGLDGIFYIEDVVRFRETAAGVDQWMVTVAGHDRKSTRIRLVQDPGAAGKAQSSYHSKLLAGYTFTIKPATGSKESWASPLAAQAEAGTPKRDVGRDVKFVFGRFLAAREPGSIERRRAARRSSGPKCRRAGSPPIRVTM